MRENMGLFRGKRTDNGEWIYWNIYGEICRESGKRTRIAIPNNNGESYYHYIHQIKHLIDTSTIGRFTALTDKNGKKIFEGDVGRGLNMLHPSRKIYQVVYEDNGFYYCDEKGAAWHPTHIESFEVIGNIHDNPELSEVNGNDNT